MHEPLKWLPDADGTAWVALGNAVRNGLPVPAGFFAFASSAEEHIRNAYEDLRLRTRIHFVAVRGVSHPVLNVIGPDQLMHTLRRLWSESPDPPVLVQTMIHAMWCGKAHSHRRNVQIKANEGMMLLDPDTYVVNGATGKIIRRALEAKQRKMIRHVEGTAKVVQREGERTPMTDDQLKSVAELTLRAGKDIGWVIDDNDRLWLISI